MTTTEAAGPAGATASLATYVASTRYEDLPEAVVDAVKWAVLDTLSVAIAGAAEPAARTVTATLEQFGGAPRSSVIGHPFRTDPASAALANGVIGHALDYDDVSFALSAHPSVSLLPAILAIAEDEGASGRDVVRAYAVGFEAAMRLSTMINPSHYRHGWHGTGTVGTFAATFAASNLLGLNAGQATDAMALAASTAAGLRANFGTDVKPYHAGNAGRAGVMAATLARAGFRGERAILEATHGFFAVMVPGDQASAVGTEALGWSILDPGITTKLIPSCASTHASIGSILALRAAGLRADEVESIDVTLTDISAGNLRHPNPRTGLEAKFSLQYCMARALVSGGLVLDDFTDEAAVDPSLRDLMSRISMRADRVLTAEYRWGSHRPSVMSVRTRSGGLLSHRTDVPPGAPGALSRDLLLVKVQDCVGRGDIAAAADALVDCVDRLETQPDVRELMALLRAPTA